MILSQLFRQALLVTTLLLVSGLSQASALFTGSVFGEFDNPNAGYWDYTRIHNNDLGNASSDASVFNWGKTSRNWGNGCRSWFGCVNHSNFSFDGVGSDRGEAGFSVAANQAFSLGDFTYTNEATYYSRNVTGVDFTIDLDIDGVGSTDFTYTMEILNTPNTSPDPADYAALSNGISTQSVILSGIEYKLEILGFSRDGGMTFESYTWANEHTSTTAGIYAQFNTVSAVPVPAAAWLFGSGLIALFSMMRKRK
jgi:hypothetical protein